MGDFINFTGLAQGIFNKMNNWKGFGGQGMPTESNPELIYPLFKPCNIILLIIYSVVQSFIGCSMKLHNMTGICVIDLNF